MAEVSELKVIPFPACQVIGRALRVGPGKNPVPAMWAEMYSDGSIARLAELPRRVHREAFVGWLGEYDPGTRTFTYLVGVLCAPGEPAPDGMRAIPIPACTMAMGTVPAGPPHGYHANVKAYTEAGYVADLDFELEWFEGTKENGTFRYCSPVKPK